MSEQYNKFLSAKVRVFYSNVDTIDRGPKMLGIDSRPLGLLRQGVDMIVLRDTTSNRGEWKNAKVAFGYLESQVIWKPGDREWLLSTTVELEKVFCMISARFICHQGVVIVPRVVTPEFVAVCNAHKLDFVGTDVNQHEGKSCLHTNKMVKDALTFEHCGVSVTTLRGISGITRESLIKASEEFRDTGVRKVMFKPKELEGGVGVQLIDLLSEKEGISSVPAQYSEMDWVLEEFIDDVQVTVVTTCWGGEVLSVSDQVQSGFCHTGNLFPSRTDAEVQEACKIVCQKLSSLLDIECPWGIDAILYLDENGNKQLAVVDINVARFCGGHYPSLFGKARGIAIKSWLVCKDDGSTSKSALNSSKVTTKATGYSTLLHYILN